MYYIIFLPCPTAYHELGPTHMAYSGCCHCCQSCCASYIVLWHPTVWQNSISYICTYWCCMGCRAHGRPSRAHLVWTWGSPPCLQNTGHISPGHAWRAAGNLPVSMYNWTVDLPCRGTLSALKWHYFQVCPSHGLLMTLLWVAHTGSQIFYEDAKNLLNSTILYWFCLLTWHECPHPRVHPR